MSTGILPNQTDFHAVGAGNIATLTLPQDGVLHNLDLIYTKAGVRQIQSVIEADIEYVEILIGGKPQRRITPARLFKIDATKNQSFKAGRIPLRFSQPERRTDVGEDMTAWVLSRLLPVTIKIKLASGVTGTPVFQSSLKWERFDGKRGQGPIVTYSTESIEVTDTSKKYTYKPDGRLLSYIHMFTDQLSHVNVFIGREKIYDADFEDFQNLLEDVGLTAQSDVLTLGGEAFSQRISDALGTNGNVLRFEFELLTVANFDIIYEELGAALS